MFQTNNRWHNKARALDRYRWQQYRERHGLFGSLSRFLRDALVDWCYGCYAKWCAGTPTECRPCDYLLLQSAPRIIDLKRKKALIDTLRERGHVLIETALPERLDACRNRQLVKPPFAVPTRYFEFAAHAEWICRVYQPRVLLNDRNGSLYSPFLRLSLAARSAQFVHLAHATTAESSRRLGMNDYDYYLLFGRSSLDALLARTLRFGTSTILLTGSHMIDRSFDIPPATATGRTVLVLGVGPDREKEIGYHNTYAMLRDWAAQHPDYRVLIKRHPRSTVPFWQEASQVLPNIVVLSADCPLAKALEQASIVVNIMSNAVIEAGLAGRPVIFCNLSDNRDIFTQEAFFGPVVTSVQKFDANIQMIESDYLASVRRARDFADFHLANGFQGLEKTVGVLEDLLAGRRPSGVEQFTLSATT